LAGETCGRNKRRASDEIEVARIETEDWAVPETVGLSLDEGKRIAAAIQAETVRGQASTMSEHFGCCGHCGLSLSSKDIGADVSTELSTGSPLLATANRRNSPKPWSALGLPRHAGDGVVRWGRRVIQAAAPSLPRSNARP
jgi:hypothetical protein